MNTRIVQPVGKIKLTNVATVRYDYKGKRFEIACYKNKIVNWRNGVEKDIDEVLQIPNVFLNASKGVTASKEDLMNCFGTTNTSEISKVILDKGVEQVSGKEREHQLQAMASEIATAIAEICYNPDTEAPYTATMIQRAMKDNHYSIKLNQSIKKQTLECITFLKHHIRIQRKQMLIQLSYPESKRDTVCEYVDHEGMTALGEEWKGGKVATKVAIDTKQFKEVEQFCKSNRSVVCEILEQKYVCIDRKTKEPAQNVREPETKEEKVEEPVSKGNVDYSNCKLKCSTCLAGFEEGTSYREHFRSDWHRYNLKRKNKNLPVMNEKEYDGLDDTDRELFLKMDSVAT